MTTYELVLPYTRPPLNQNQRLHWAVKGKLTKDIKLTTFIIAQSMRLPKGVDFASIELVYYPPGRKPRDEDNLSPTLKACADGIVQYGLVPDDNSEHVKSWCTIGPVVKGGKVALNITIDDDQPVTE